LCDVAFHLPGQVLVWRCHTAQSRISGSSPHIDREVDDVQGRNAGCSRNAPTASPAHTVTDHGDQVATAPEAPHDQPAVIRWVSRLEIWAGTIFFALIFFGVMYQVLGRYIPAVAWVGAGEVARLSMVALTFVVAGYLIGKNGHIVIEVFDAILEGKKLFVVLRIFAAVVMVLTCGALAWEAFLMIEQGWGRVSTSLHMPLAVIYIFAFVGFVSGTLHSLVKITSAGRPEPRLDISEMEG
jgi:TRAP-type C4-dicarboxylate transport system permease small subunit